MQMTDVFDPLVDVPMTDEEVKVALQRSGNKLVVASLQGLYDSFRKKGETVPKAFRLALEAHVAAIEIAGN